MYCSITFVERSAVGVILDLERIGYLGKPVSVPYATQQTTQAGQIAGVTIYNALQGSDYQLANGIVEFAAGQVLKSWWMGMGKRGVGRGRKREAEGRTVREREGGKRGWRREMDGEGRSGREGRTEGGREGGWKGEEKRGEGWRGWGMVV